MLTVSQPNGEGSISVFTPALLFEKLWSPLVHYAMNITGNEKDAEDIVSEVFVKLVNSQKTFPRFEDAKPYLYIMVRNLCYDYLALAKRTKKSNADLSYLHAQSADILALHKTEITDQHLRQAMATLSDSERSFLKLCLDKSLSAEEISQRTGLTVNTIYNKKCVLLQRLRNELKKHKK
jgi:RNA polymerase sigma factor (sigma-70 family)